MGSIISQTGMIDDVPGQLQVPGKSSHLYNGFFPYFHVAGWDK